MSLDPADMQSLSVHRLLVEKALRQVIGLHALQGGPVEQVVARFYDAVSEGGIALVLHRDPLGLAYDLAGDEAPRPSEEDAGQRKRYEELVSRFLKEQAPSPPRP